MTIGYRSMLSARLTEESVDSTREVLTEWITQKKRFAALPGTGKTLYNDRGSTLSAEEFSDSERDIAGYRWTLTEEWSPPRWATDSQSSRTGVTEVSLIFAGKDQWLWVDIEPPTLEYVDRAGHRRIEPQPSGTPAFVQDILRKVKMRDGIESPSSDIQPITVAGDLEHLVNVLKDPTRFGAAYVTAPPFGVSEQDWRRQTEEILGRIEGMGFGYVLNASMQKTFNRVVAQGHGIPAGSIRTFLPGADLTDSNDTIRHRLLHASTIRDSDPARLQRIIRNAQVERLQDIDLPEVLLDADERFEREKNRRAIAALREMPAPKVEEAPEVKVADQAEAIQSKLNEAEEILNLAFEESAHLREELRLERSSADELREENDLLYLEATRIRGEVERSHRLTKYLQQELAKLGNEGATSAYGYVDAEMAPECPSTFSELLKRMSSFEYVRFYGDPAATEDLDEQSGLGPAAISRAWDALITFNEYARARTNGSIESSLKEYINNTEHGLPMRIPNVKWSESKTVRNNRKMSAQRTVTGLPPEIDPSGSKTLLAHIPLATGRGLSPRLYFDDMFEGAGCVLVGYIGAHLVNTQTN